MVSRKKDDDGGSENADIALFLDPLSLRMGFILLLQQHRYHHRTLLTAMHTMQPLCVLLYVRRLMWIIILWKWQTIWCKLGELKNVFSNKNSWNKLLIIKAEKNWQIFLTWAFFLFFLFYYCHHQLQIFLSHLSYFLSHFCSLTLFGSLSFSENFLLHRHILLFVVVITLNLKIGYYQSIRDYHSMQIEWKF